MVFDLALNFFVLAANDGLAERRPDGLIETAPGFRSMLVTYDPAAISTVDLVGHLQHGARRARIRAGHDDPEPGRPHADRVRRRADTRSGRALRPFDPQATRRTPRAGTNIDYVVRYNGLRDRDELYETVLATEHWTAFIGFFPGLPFMFPLDPRDAVFVPKYNPTRTWTPEGALGIGGPCFAIYPVESAGRLPADRPHAPDLRRARAQRGVPREPAAPARRRPCPLPPRRGGRAAPALRGRSRGHVPLPDRGRALRRRAPSSSGPRPSPTRRTSGAAGGRRPPPPRARRSPSTRSH